MKLIFGIQHRYPTTYSGYSSEHIVCKICKRDLLPLNPMRWLYSFLLLNNVSKEIKRLRVVTSSCWTIHVHLQIFLAFHLHSVRLLKPVVFLKDSLMAFNKNSFYVLLYGILICVRWVTEEHQNFFLKKDQNIKFWVLYFQFLAIFEN